MTSRMALPLQRIGAAAALAALPLQSVVREVTSNRAGADQGRTWERRRSGWRQLSGPPVEPAQHDPALPVRLLWHPKWREILD